MDILPKNKISPTTEKKEFKMPDIGGLGTRFSFGQKNTLETSETKLPLIGALIILFLVVIIWFGLLFYKNSIDKKIESTKQQTESLSEQENKEMQTKILALEKNLKNVKNLLSQHIYSSKLLALLEKLTLPQVRWTDFNFKIESGLLSLKGQANNYSTLAKQILIFQEEPSFKEVKTSGISLGQLGGVKFNMEINLNPEIFKK